MNKKLHRRMLVISFNTQKNESNTLTVSDPGRDKICVLEVIYIFIFIDQLLNDVKCVVIFIIRMSSVFFLSLGGRQRNLLTSDRLSKGLCTRHPLEAVAL